METTSSSYPRDSEIPNKKMEVKDITFPKYPMGISNRLIDFFYVFGYEEKYIDGIIAKEIDAIVEAKNEEAKKRQKSRLQEIREELSLGCLEDELSKYQCKTRPSVLSAIKVRTQLTEDLMGDKNNFKDILYLKEYELIPYIFPTCPSVFYQKIKDGSHNAPKPYSIVTSNVHLNISNFI